MHRHYTGAPGTARWEYPWPQADGRSPNGPAGPPGRGPPRTVAALPASSARFPPNEESAAALARPHPAGPDAHAVSPSLLSGLRPKPVPPWRSDDAQPLPSPPAAIRPRVRIAPIPRGVRAPMAHPLPDDVPRAPLGPVPHRLRRRPGVSRPAARPWRARGTLPRPAGRPRRAATGRDRPSLPVAPGVPRAHGGHVHGVQGDRGHRRGHGRPGRPAPEAVRGAGESEIDPEPIAEPVICAPPHPRQDAAPGGRVLEDAAQDGGGGAQGGAHAVQAPDPEVQAR